LRIIQLGKYYPPASGGIETHTQTLSRALVRHGHTVEVIVANHSDPRGHDVTFERWRKTHSTQDDDGSVAVRRVGRVAQVAKLDLAPDLFRCLQDHAKNPPDVWHLHTPNITMMLAILALRKIRPLLITHHSDIIRQKVLRHLVQPLEQALYRRADRIIATSEPYIAGSATLGRVREKTFAVPLGLSLDRFLNPSLAALSAAESARSQLPGPIWLSVGRLIYYKGLGTALAALQKVPGRLVVVGTGPMEATWRQEAETLGVADRIVWKGRASAEELIGLYHAATAHWFPSNARSEGFGLVQVEAMASGCPTINTAIPHSGVSWVCPHEQAGLTVPMNDPAALAAAAQRLLQEPGLRSRLAQTGRTLAIQSFSDDAMAQAYIRHYQELQPR